MPLANKTDKTDLLCPTCQRVILNYAPHPTIAGRTIAYCICNPIGPVLEFDTEHPPAAFTQAAGPQPAGATQEK